jgi:hypothetical protein
MNEGTITWFEFEKNKPITENGIWLLCYYGPHSPIDSNYYWSATKSFTGNKCPSHWVYINEPIK